MVDGHLAVYARPRDAERLHTGDAVTKGALADLHRCYQDYGAYRQAVRFLSARDRSVREVRKHLRAKGWEAAACDRAVERLQAEGYLDDHAFARRWVDMRCRTSPRSRLAVIQELKQKGVLREAIDAAVACMDEAALDELESAHRTMSEMVSHRAAKEYEAVNTEFHSLIFRGAGNDELSQMAFDMRLKLAPFRRSQLYQIDRMRRSNTEHALIVQLLRERNRPGVEQALRGHLRGAAEAVLAQRQ